MNIKIVVATHKKVCMPCDDMYLPVLAGSVLHEDLIKEYQPDNEGENISEKNPYYSELTALYWAWKNMADADYIGLVHYRRYFSLKKSKHDIKYVLKKSQVEKMLGQYDVIVTNKRHYYIETLASHYGHANDMEHIEITRKIIGEIASDYVSDFDVVMKRTSGHLFNMMIMKRDILCDYCEWLFPILFRLEENVDAKLMTAYEARYVGRVAELLLDVWLRHNKIKYKEVPMMQIGDVNWTKKIIGFLGAKFFGRKYTYSK